MNQEQFEQKEAHFRTLPEWVREAFYKDRVVFEVISAWKYGAYTDEELMEKLAFFLFKKASHFEEIALDQAMRNPPIMQFVIPPSWSAPQ